MPASYATHRRQLELILRAWGMPDPMAGETAEIMSWADLHGIDTHGISMIPSYDERRRAGRMNMSAKVTASRETPVSALVDGGGGLGHPAARRAMELAIAKARTTGIGVAAVRNSAHFGACGFYALMAVDAGLIGMVTTSASGIQVAPTHGAQARLGTDPIAFAAPGKQWSSRVRQPPIPEAISVRTKPTTPKPDVGDQPLCHRARPESRSLDPNPLSLCLAHHLTDHKVARPRQSP